MSVPLVRRSLPGTCRYSAGERRVAAWLILVAHSLAPRVGAQAEPHGGQFQVNSYTTGDQIEAAVAVDARSRFVVVWTSYGSYGADTSGSSIQSRRLDAEGRALGPQIQVNVFTPDNQSSPSVASDPDGNFTVAWQSEGSSGGDSSGLSVQFRRFSANGSPLGPESQVNVFTSNDQSLPDIAIDDQGRFVVVWNSLGYTTSDNSLERIEARRFDPTGAPLGDPFLVNQYTFGAQKQPAVASLPGGGFVITWQSAGSFSTDQSGYSIQGRRYDAAGSPLGGEFQVNAYTMFAQVSADVAAGATGHSVVTFESYGSPTDDEGFSIHQQRYDPSGNPLAGKLQVNTFTEGNQLQPTATMDSSGDFVVAWFSEQAAPPDDLNSIHARRRAASGEALGSAFQVNEHALGTGHPSVASDSSGNFVLAWQGGSAGSDVGSSSIQVRLFDALFRDGFEAGTTARWDLTAP